MNINDRLLRKRIIILDGATGTNLLDRGLLPGEPPSILNLKNPQVVYQLQRRYIDSGSDIILTNTFSANPVNFKGEKYKEIIKAGVKIARRAAGDRSAIFGDVGPLGILLKPYGDAEFEEVYRVYLEIFKTFYKSGLRNFFIETFNSIVEAKVAFVAAKEFSENIFVSFTFQNDCRTLFGEIPESIAITFESLGARAIGANCTEPETVIEVLKKMRKVTNLPLVAKPNAGKVTIDANRVRNSISDRELAGYFYEFVNAGACFIGGCCGTSPEYINLINKSKSKVKPRCGNKKNKRFYLASPQKFIEIENNSTIIVGERLNPSGRKKLREALSSGDYKIYGSEAKAQESAGANALDINTFVPELDECKVFINCLYEVIKNSKIPVFIDTQNFNTAINAMMVYPGVGVYNSIPAREKELKKYLPVAKKYGFGVVVSLVGKKVPRSVKERVDNVNLALTIAKKLKFPLEKMIFDPLVFSIATEPEQIEETLRTIEILSKKNLKTILGISNVSFGLPERSLLNSILVTLAINSGVNFLIVNPLDFKVMDNYRASRALIKKEINEYIKWAKELPEQKIAHITGKKEKSKETVYQDQEKIEILKGSSEQSFINAIIEGDVKNAVDVTQGLLNTGVSPEKIIDHYVFEAMKRVGENYEKGIFFIPDLMKSAEATKGVLQLIKKGMKKSITVSAKKGKKKIVLATVKGDIHDIGKNIVAMVFESAGYEVIDLGKDVDAKRIFDAAKKYKPIVIGLSALLTTTMTEMGNVIKLLRKKGIDTPVIIGGPNVSDGFAKQIGAYAAVNNAFEGLKVVKEIDK